MNVPLTRMRINTRILQDLYMNSYLRLSSLSSNGRTQPLSQVFDEDTPPVRPFKSLEVRQ